MRRGSAVVEVYHSPFGVIDLVVSSHGLQSPKQLHGWLADSISAGEIPYMALVTAECRRKLVKIMFDTGS